MFKEYFSVQTNGKRRLDTVNLPEAENHAQNIYRAEGIIPDMFAYPTSNVLVSPEKKAKR